MKILVEVSHPAHVHYFRNMIRILEDKGHDILVIARNKEVTFDLLKAYKIDFISFGDVKKGVVNKALGLLSDDIKLLKYSLKYKPDLFLSFSSPFVGHIACLFNKPHLVFDDTEHSKLEHFMYKPFASKIITPKVFTKDMGKKHTKVDSFFEMCYLHPKYYKVDKSILNSTGIKDCEKYVILRFISWDAIHDKGQSGISLEFKRKAVKELSKYAKVYISSENALPADLAKYQLKVSPEKIHDLMSQASLFFGESGTMAVESAILGTPSVRVSSLAKTLGNFKELKNNYELVYYYDNAEEGLQKSIEIMKDKSSKESWMRKRDLLLDDKTDFTAYMVYIVELHLNRN